MKKKTTRGSYMCRPAPIAGHPRFYLSIWNGWAKLQRPPASEPSAAKYRILMAVRGWTRHAITKPP